MTDTIKISRELRPLLERMCGLLSNASVETGICCCGSPVSSHGFGDGHSPVDQGAQVADAIREELRVLLATHPADAADMTGQPSEPQGGEEVDLLPRDDSDFWSYLDGKFGKEKVDLWMSSKRGHGALQFAWGVFVDASAQHRRLMAEQLERERGVVEALRLIAAADSLVVTQKYRIAASEALAAWERNHAGK